MEERKKRLRINFFDIAIIILILLVAGAAYLLSHNDGGAEVISRSYVVELQNLDASMADCVQIGDAVTDSVKNYPIGTVTDIAVTPYRIISNDLQNGAVRETEVPGKISLLLTVQVDTTETQRDITTLSGYVLRTGTGVSCQVGKLVSKGYILKIDR